MLFFHVCNNSTFFIISCKGALSIRIAWFALYIIYTHTCSYTIYKILNRFHRFMAYSIISNPWLFLLFELLHGPSFGLCWPAMVSYGDKVTPSGTKATMQGFIGAVFEGIGVSSGSFICGWLMDTYGGIIALRVFSVGALIWLGGFWLMELLLRKFKAYPLHQGHNHLANYANPDDAILMTISQELQTY